MMLAEYEGKFGSTTCLWEALTLCAAQERNSEENKITKLLQLLGESSCMNWQEIGISASSEGWIVHIRSCSEDGKIDILIPKDRTIPVKVLTDTRMTSNFYESRG